MRGLSLILAATCLGLGPDGKVSLTTAEHIHDEPAQNAYEDAIIVLDKLASEQFYDYSVEECSVLVSTILVKGLGLREYVGYQCAEKDTNIFRSLSVEVKRQLTTVRVFPNEVLEIIEALGEFARGAGKDRDMMKFWRHGDSFEGFLKWMVGEGLARRDLNNELSFAEVVGEITESGRKTMARAKKYLEGSAAVKNMYMSIAHQRYIEENKLAFEKGLRLCEGKVGEGLCKKVIVDSNRDMEISKVDALARSTYDLIIKKVVEERDMVGAEELLNDFMVYGGFKAVLEWRRTREMFVGIMKLISQGDINFVELSPLVEWISDSRMKYSVFIAQWFELYTSIDEALDKVAQMKVIASKVSEIGQLVDRTVIPNIKGQLFCGSVGKNMVTRFLKAEIPSDYDNGPPKCEDYLSTLLARILTLEIDVTSFPDAVQYIDVTWEVTKFIFKPFEDTWEDERVLPMLGHIFSLVRNEDVSVDVAHLELLKDIAEWNSREAFMEELSEAMLERSFVMLVQDRYLEIMRTAHIDSRFSFEERQAALRLGILKELLEEKALVKASLDWWAKCEVKKDLHTAGTDLLTSILLSLYKSYKDSFEFVNVLVLKVQSGCITHDDFLNAKILAHPIAAQTKDVYRGWYTTLKHAVETYKSKTTVFHL